MIKITCLSKCPKSYTCLKSNITRHHAPMLFGKGFLKLTAPGFHTKFPLLTALNIYPYRIIVVQDSSGVVHWCMYEQPNLAWFIVHNHRQYAFDEFSRCRIIDSISEEG